MTERLIVLDTNAVINLFAAKGAAGWDQLFDVGQRVIFLDVIKEELPGAVNNAIKDGANTPNDLAAQFESWVLDNSDQVLESPIGDP